MAESASAGFEWATAPMDEIRRAFEASGSSTTPRALDWSDYAAAVGDWIASILERVLAPVAKAVGFNASWFGYLALACAAVAVVALLLRLFRERRAPAAQNPSRNVVTSPSTPQESDREWRAEADARLSQGDIPGALGAVWWWFAEGALRSRAEPMMTTNDVLTRSGRKDLRSQAQRLDRLRFGSATPDIGEIRSLIAAFESAL